MLYEIAYVANGTLVRGGISASLRTVGRWVEANTANDPDHVYVAVPANKYAVPLAEHNKSIDAPEGPYEFELIDHIPGQVIEPKSLPEVEIPEDFNI